MLILVDSTLPPQIDYFHSLVPLDTSNQKNAALFGYPSWIYKAISSKDGNIYALRRLEGTQVFYYVFWHLEMLNQHGLQGIVLPTKRPYDQSMVGSVSVMAMSSLLLMHSQTVALAIAH